MQQDRTDRFGFDRVDEEDYQKWKNKMNKLKEDE